MLKLSNSSNILMCNEYESKLYLMDSDKESILHIYSINILSQPVYLYEYNKYIYCACYGDDDEPSAGILKLSINDKKINLEQTIPIEGIIHQINSFNNILLATNLEQMNLLQIDSSNSSYTSVCDFSPNKPRHFTVIDDSYIAVLSESPSVYLYILKYKNKDNKFSIETSYNFNNNNFLKTDVSGIAGAEITYIEPYIYTTIRGYKKPLQPNMVVEEYNDITANDIKQTNGYFCRIKFINSGLNSKDISFIKVGIEPRYFTINNSIAYVTNQYSNSISIIDSSKFKLIQTIKTENEQPAFLLQL